MAAGPRRPARSGTSGPMRQSGPADRISRFEQAVELPQPGGRDGDRIGPAAGRVGPRADRRIQPFLQDPVGAGLGRPGNRGKAGTHRNDGQRGRAGRLHRLRQGLERCDACADARASPRSAIQLRRYPQGICTPALAPRASTPAAYTVAAFPWQHAQKGLEVRARRGLADRPGFLASWTSTRPAFWSHPTRAETLTGLIFGGGTAGSPARGRSQVHPSASARLDMRGAACKQRHIGS